MTESCGLLIVDDQTVFRQGLRALLELCPDVTVLGDAADGLEALQKAREFHPDVILMDVKMPRYDGLQATSLIKQELPEVKVIILTVHGNEPELVYQAIKAGAIGYVSKTSGIDDILKAIRSVTHGEAVVASPALTSLVAFIGHSSDNLSAQPWPADALSSREQEVLDLVAEGLSNREIAHSLCISESTVHSHLHNILDKLHLANRVQAAAYALTIKQAHRDQTWQPPDQPTDTHPLKPRRDQDAEGRAARHPSTIGRGRAARTAPHPPSQTKHPESRPPRHD